MRKSGTCLQPWDEWLGDSFEILTRMEVIKVTLKKNNSESSEILKEESGLKEVHG